MKTSNRYIQSAYTLLLLFLTLLHVNGQTHKWVVTGGGVNSDNCTAASIDGSGNTITGGYFESPTHFGDTTITPPPFNGNYLTKYDADGSLAWIKTLSTSYGDIIKIKHDDKDNIYILGSYNTDTAKFGNIILPPSTPFGYNFSYYLAKCSPQGDFEWVKTFSTGAYTNYIKNLYVDSLGDSYILGGYSDSITIGDIELGQTSSESNIFLAKINTSGNIDWARRVGTAGPVYLQQLALTGSKGNIIITGFLAGSAQLDGQNFENEPFLYKLGPNGNTIWIKHYGGVAIDTDANGNIFTLKNDSLFTYAPDGSFLASYKTIPLSSSLKIDAFGNAYIGRKDIYDLNEDQIVAAKFNSSGGLEWSARAKGYIDFADIAVGLSGQVVLGGSFSANEGTIDNEVVYNNSHSFYLKDFFLVNFDFSLGAAYVNESYDDKITGVQSSENVAFAVSPNPFNNKIRLEMNQNAGNTEIVITDLTGRPYFHNMSLMTSSVLELDLSGMDMNPGMYLITVKGDGVKTSATRIVKQ